jgi:hypothetical protein
MYTVTWNDTNKHFSKVLLVHVQMAFGNTPSMTHAVRNIEQLLSGVPVIFNIDDRETAIRFMKESMHGGVLCTFCKAAF